MTAYNAAMRSRSVISLLGLPVLAALTFAVASCGGGSSAPAVTVPAGALVVKAGPGLVFDKSDYTIVASGGKVVIAYVQNDTQRHTLVVRDASGIVIGEKMEAVKKGSTDIATFDLPPGTYVLQCDVPGHGAMKATLTVT